VRSLEQNSWVPGNGSTPRSQRWTPCAHAMDHVALIAPSPCVPSRHYRIAPRLRRQQEAALGVIQAAIGSTFQSQQIGSGFNLFCVSARAERNTQDDAAEVGRCKRCAPSSRLLPSSNSKNAFVSMLCGRDW
jgi:hypothetical protein